MRLTTKGRFAVTAMIDLALFRIDWDDIQVRVSENGLSWMGNAGSARSQGAELSLMVRPAERLT